MWEPRALDALEQLAEYMPAAARDALEAMERMASTGFNYGRLTRKGILWYLPPKLGLFYLDDGRTLPERAIVRGGAGGSPVRSWRESARRAPG